MPYKFKVRYVFRKPGVRISRGTNIYMPVCVRVTQNDAHGPADESLYRGLYFIRMVCRPSIGQGRTQFSGLAGSQIKYHSLRLATL